MSAFHNNHDKTVTIFYSPKGGYNWRMKSLGRNLRAYDVEPGRWISAEMKNTYGLLYVGGMGNGAAQKIKTNSNRFNVDQFAQLRNDDPHGYFVLRSTFNEWGHVTGAELVAFNMDNQIQPEAGNFVYNSGVRGITTEIGGGWGTRPEQFSY